MKLIKNPIQKYLTFMHKSPKLELSQMIFQITIILNLLQRGSILFPDGGWGNWIYSDFKLDTMKYIFRFLYIEQSLWLKAILLAVNIFFIVCNFARISFVYHYNYILYELLFLPQLLIFAQISDSLSLSIIGIILLLIQVYFVQFFNRSVKVLDINPFIRRYTKLIHLQIALDAAAMILVFKLSSVLLLLLGSLVRLFDIIWHHQKYNLGLEASFTSMIVIVLLNIGYGSEENLVLNIAIVMPFVWKLLDVISPTLRSINIDEYFIISECEELLLSTHIQHEQLIQEHLFQCTKNHKNIFEFAICKMNKFLENYKSELVELAVVDMLSQTKAALQSYRLLKYCQSQRKSIYFQLIINLIDDQVWQQVKESQRISRITLDEIRIKDIHKANLFADRFIPLTLKLIENKIIHQQKLNQKISLQQLFSINLNLAKAIKSYSDKIEDILSSIKKETIVILKILEIFHIIGLNDPRTAIKYQKAIFEMVRVESLYNQYINKANLDDSMVLVYVSMVNNRGRLIRQNINQVAKFWEFDNEVDFREIIEINQLMPDYLAEIHHIYVDAFLEKGTSPLLGKARQIYLKNRVGFHVPVTIKIDNFPIVKNDYVLCGLFIKNKLESNFIIFNDEGRIIGLDQGIFDIFKSVDQSITLYDILNSYVFLLIPDIFQLLARISDNNQSINVLMMYVGLQLKQYLNQTSDPKSQYSIQISKTVKTFSQKKSIQSKGNILDPDYQQLMIKLIRNFQYKTKPFIINCKLSPQLVVNQTIYILEIIEITPSEQEIETNILNRTTHLSIDNSLSDHNMSSIQPEDQIRAINSQATIYKLLNKDQDDMIKQIDTQKNLWESNRSIQPNSQRALFNIIRHKSLNDDSKLVEGAIQNIEFDAFSPVQQSRDPEIPDDRIEMVQQQVNSITTVSGSDKSYHYQLIRNICFKQTLITPLKILILTNSLSSVIILVLIILNTLYQQQFKQNHIQDILNVRAPYQYNKFFCQLYSQGSIIFSYKAQFLYLSPYLIKDYQDFYLKNTILDEMATNYDLFLNLEALGLFPEMTITFIQEPNAFNYTFTPMYSILREKFNDIIKFGQKIEPTVLDQTTVILGAFFINNFYNYTTIFQSMISTLIDRSNQQEKDNQATMLNVLLLSISSQVLIILIQVKLYLQITTYYKQINVISARIHNDEIEQNIAQLKFFANALKSTWKKTNFFHILDFYDVSFKPKQQSKMIVSKINSFRLFFLKPLIIVLLMVFLQLSQNLGSYYLSYSQQQQLTPTINLTINFLQMTAQMDSLITMACRAKTQNLVVYYGNVIKIITVQKAVVYSYLAGAQPTSDFNLYFKDFMNQSQKIITFVENIQSTGDSEAAEFSNLLKNSVCPWICTNVSFPQDNNTQYSLNGIVGIQTYLKEFFISNFDIEIQKNTVDLNYTNTVKIMNKPEFEYMFARHFLNTNKVFVYFIKQLLAYSTNQIESQYNLYLIYLILTGSALFILFVSCYYYLIREEYQILILMRLSLLQLNMNTVDVQSLTLIRQL